MNSVIVLNADFTYLHTVSWKRGMRLVLKGKVEVLKYGGAVVTSFQNLHRIPLVVRLIKFVRRVYKNKVPLNKRNILARDEYTCQYCGAGCRHNPTLDHILPKSRGGSFSWQNTVASCKRCNQKKGDKTPTECGMTLRKKPVQPTISEFTNQQVKQMGLREILKDLV
jgi:5-methylcytosine-specific restriction endonuclease McrA